MKVKYLLNVVDGRILISNPELETNTDYVTISDEERRLIVSGESNFKAVLRRRYMREREEEAQEFLAGKKQDEDDDSDTGTKETVQFKGTQLRSREKYSTVKQTLKKVGSNVDLARAELTDERMRDNPRPSLIEALEKIIADGEADDAELEEDVSGAEDDDLSGIL